MKSIVSAAGCFALLCCLSPSAFGFTGLGSGKEIQNRFFDAVSAGDAAKIHDEMHPDLQVLVDQPVLAELFSVLKEKLGPVQSIRQTGFSINVDSDGKWIHTEAEVTCQHGTLHSKLVTLDGQLTRFNVNSEKLINWFRVPGQTDVYEKLGASFLKKFMAGQCEESWGMLHKNLRDAVTLEAFTEMSTQVTAATGKLRKIEVLGTRVKKDDGPIALLVDFKLSCEDGEGGRGRNPIRRFSRPPARVPGLRQVIGRDQAFQS